LSSQCCLSACAGLPQINQPCSTWEPDYDQQPHPPCRSGAAVHKLPPLRPSAPPARATSVSAWPSDPPSPVPEQPGAVLESIPPRPTARGAIASDRQQAAIVYSSEYGMSPLYYSPESTRRFATRLRLWLLAITVDRFNESCPGQGLALRRCPIEPAHTRAIRLKLSLLEQSTPSLSGAPNLCHWPCRFPPRHRVPKPGLASRLLLAWPSARFRGVR